LVGKKVERDMSMQWLLKQARSAALVVSIAGSPSLVAAPRDHRAGQPDWLGSELPLPLPVRSAPDLQFKGQTERQYLIFNLMAAGKVGWDANDFVTAAEKWEALLQIPALDPEIDKAVRPFAIEARSRAGKPGLALPPPPVLAGAAADAAKDAAPVKRRSSYATVEGTISGGGAIGPGGTVITLHRASGPTPRPVPLKDRIVLQRDKMFAPHVLAVPIGTMVTFRNVEEEKRIYHDVFSLSPAGKFDTGLYEAPGEKTHVFDQAGVIQLLCNIHAKMNGYIDVVDTPWFAQADASGNFRISGVPPGDYDVEVWHESAARATKQRVTIARDGAKLAFTVGADKANDPNPPDKYGKPRQEQLGY